MYDQAMPRFMRRVQSFHRCPIHPRRNFPAPVVIGWPVRLAAAGAVAWAVAFAAAERRFGAVGAAPDVVAERRAVVAAAAGRPPWVASFAASAVQPLPFALPDASPS